MHRELFGSNYVALRLDLNDRQQTPVPFPFTFGSKTAALPHALPCLHSCRLSYAAIFDTSWNFPGIGVTTTPKMAGAGGGPLETVAD